MTTNEKEKQLKTHLESLSKEQLIDRVIQLEKHSNQLRNLLKKCNNEKNTSDNSKLKKRSREFDFKKMTKRHVLLRFYYLGWNYQGFATQEDITQTIEHHLFQALHKTCLIESRETSNYHRCGRTDKGVSAFHQVISIDVRSKLSEAEIKNYQNLDKELSYCTMLNRVLPPDIQCVAWMPVNNPLYSARFDCKQRTYRYVFPKGDLDLELMKEAGTYMVGLHDFRNLCKMDVNNGVTTFIRNISSIDIKPVERREEDKRVERNSGSGYELYYFEIESQAFLWHQIRCIVAVLFLVGQKLEKPEIVKELLDIDCNPCKPNYHMASYLPLNLYSCKFKDLAESRPPDETEVSDTDLTDWIVDDQSLRTVIGTLQGQWCMETVKSKMIKMMLNDLEELYHTKFPNQSEIIEQIYVLRDEKKSKAYKPLMTRQTCQSLEERIENIEAKRRRTEKINEIISLNENKDS